MMITKIPTWRALTNNVEHVLNILGMVRSAYHKAKAELM